MNKNKQVSTKLMVLTAALTAMVVVLQLLGSFIHLGMFSISLVLVPIVIGAAICGVGSGAWLGFAFGLAVLISGDAASFLAVDPFGTVITVLAKGTAAGFVSGLIYKLFARLCNSWKERAKPIKSEKLSKIRDLTLKYLPVLIAAIVCPIVNTGIFLIGCNLFFYSTLSEWAKALGYENAAKYMIFGLAGGNFLFELLFNVFLSPTIVRVLDLFSNKFRSKKASNAN
jgi:uncharacterized membrane protein